jgi:AraC-like DNA-binding protein
MSAPASPIESSWFTDLGAWRDALSQAFVPLEAIALGDRSDFRGRLRCESISDLQFSVVSGSRQVARRTRRLVQRSAADVYKVGVQLQGHGVVQQDGRVARLGPGDLAVYDTARPYELVFEEDFEMLVMVVPRHRLAVRAPGLDDLSAITISGASGSGALASALLRGLDPRTTQPGPEAIHLSDAAVAVLAACLVGRTDNRLPPPAVAVLVAAQRYIDNHLSDPSLTPARVAAAVHLSLRQLQKLFERQAQTIAGCIRERRLERCWRDLADPGLAHRPVSAIAASSGFVDAAYFSRVFRLRFGMCPRERREQLLGAAG